VQAGAASVGGVHHPRDQGGAVRAEDRLRRLDLDLEAQAARLQAQHRLEVAGGVHHRLHLVDRGHLRQRDHEAPRQRPAVAEPRHEGRERAQPAVPGRPLQALEPDAEPGRGGAVGDRDTRRAVEQQSIDGNAGADV